MFGKTNGFRILSSDPNIRLNESKNRRRTYSFNLYETTTPSVNLSSPSTIIDLQLNHDLSSDHDIWNSLSAYDKLTLWKRTIERHLNRVYVHKLQEISKLLSEGNNNIDIIFDTIPSFEQIAIVKCRQESNNHSHNGIEFDYSNSQIFDLKSNNILLSTSDYNTLIFDHIQSSLILYNNQSKINSYQWNETEYGEPCDLTYSHYLDVYCIITNRGLFAWSHKNPFVPVHIDSVKSISGNRLWTMASTNTRPDVFILFKSGNYIEKWNSIIGKKSWQHIQRWSNYDLFERNDQRIRAIRMTSHYIAWTVESTKIFEWRVDLLDYHLQIIRQGIKIDNLDRYSSCLLSNFDAEQFLIIDSNRHSLFLLHSNGYIQFKNDSITDKRIKNAVFMKNNDKKWIIIRLEQPNQLYFVPLLNRIET